MKQNKNKQGNKAKNNAQNTTAPKGKEVAKKPVSPLPKPEKKQEPVKVVKPEKVNVPTVVNAPFPTPEKAATPKADKFLREELGGVNNTQAKPGAKPKPEAKPQKGLAPKTAAKVAESFFSEEALAETPTVDSSIQDILDIINSNPGINIEELEEALNKGKNGTLDGLFSVLNQRCLGFYRVAPIKKDGPNTLVEVRVGSNQRLPQDPGAFYTVFTTKPWEPGDFFN